MCHQHHLTETSSRGYYQQHTYCNDHPILQSKSGAERPERCAWRQLCRSVSTAAWGEKLLPLSILQGVRKQPGPSCCLLQICEDVPEQLDTEAPGLPDVPSKVLIPRLLQLFTSSHVEAKCLAIGVTNLLAGACPESLAPFLERCAPAARCDDNPKRPVQTLCSPGGQAINAVFPVFCRNASIRFRPNPFEQYTVPPGDVTISHIQPDAAHPALWWQHSFDSTLSNLSLNMLLVKACM